jgi:hypothetical protein
MSPTLFRRLPAFAAALALTVALSGCAVVSVAGTAVGVAAAVGSAAVSVGSAAVSVGSTVVSTTAKVAGKAVESAVGPSSVPASPPVPR